MKEFTETELLNIRGGAISGTLINAFIKGFSVLIDLGRSLGTAIRRIQTGKYC